MCARARVRVNVGCAVSHTQIGAHGIEAVRHSHWDTDRDRDRDTRQTETEAKTETGALDPVCH